MRASNFSGFLCDNLNENTLVSFSSARRSPCLVCPRLVPHAGSFPLLPGIPGQGTSRIAATPPLISAGKGRSQSVVRMDVTLGDWLAAPSVMRGLGGASRAGVAG